MTTKPDTIKISASQKVDIPASHADLHVTVRGSSVISGNEAMKKAKEVSQLAEALIDYGLSSEAVELQGVQITASSGTLLKSSGANYRLKIKSEKLDQIAELLDIIAAQKNVSLDRIEWKYDEETARAKGLDAAMTKAKSKAESVAKSLGIKLLGIYDFIENVYDEEQPFTRYPIQATPKAVRISPSTEPTLALDIQHNKKITVGVDIWYRVGEF